MYATMHYSCVKVKFIMYVSNISSSYFGTLVLLVSLGVDSLTLGFSSLAGNHGSLNHRFKFIMVNGLNSLSTILSFMG